MTVLDGADCHRRLYEKQAAQQHFAEYLRYTPWRRKKEPISDYVHLFNTWQKLVNSFAYIKESISYNSVHLILARVKDYV